MTAKPIELDPLSSEFHDSHSPSSEYLCNAIDGSVYSQGIKLTHRDWLDMGSENWATTSDSDKAKAYQIATKIGGWTDQRLCEIILASYNHIQPGIMDFTINLLKDLSSQYPLDLKDINVRLAEVQIKQSKNR